MRELRIAVIPARGGSKRIPRKNIRSFCGRPVIAYSIEAALKSGAFDHVIVSTDDEEVATIALACGAEVPFRRPLDLADDYTPTVPVIAHAIDWVSSNRGAVSVACCIYATAPFVTAADLEVSFRKLMTENVSGYVFAAAPFAFPIQRAFRILPGGFCEMFNPECYNTRSQDLEPAYQDAGQFYFGPAGAYRSGKPFFSGDSKPHVVPRYRVQDIDTMEDWVRAEVAWRVLQEMPGLDGLHGETG